MGNNIHTQQNLSESESTTYLTMVASSSNLMLLASTPAGNQHMHVRNNSTIPNGHDLLQLDPTMTRGFMIRSNSNNNIRGSTGNLKDMIMLETVAPDHTAAYPNKNGGGFSMTSSNSSSNKKKNRWMSGGNLKNLLYVLEPLTAPLPVSATSTSTDDDDDWFLGDEEGEDIISDDEEEEEEEDIITTTEITTHPTDTIITTPSTPGRKSNPSPPKNEEKKIASLRVEASMKMNVKDTTIRIPVIENRSSIGSSSSSSSSASSSVGSSNLKDIMLETAALSSASVSSSLRSSTSTSTSSPVPELAPTLNATWSTNTSMEALQAMHRFLSIPLSAPTMPDLFSCIGGGATSFDHQKANMDFTKKMSSTTTASAPIQKKKNPRHEQEPDVNVHLGNRLSEVKNDLFFKLNLPSSSPLTHKEDTYTATTVSSSTCMSSPDEEQEEENFFGMETTNLSPRIMMFYQEDDDDEDDDDDDDDEDMMMMHRAPLSASRLSFYNQEQEQEVEVTPDVTHNTPSSASNLALLAGIALSLASPVSDDVKDDHDHDNDDDEYGIFLSFSDDDDNEDHTYNDVCVSSPALKYNDYAFHKHTTTTTTAPFGVNTVAGRNSSQQWME